MSLAHDHRHAHDHHHHAHEWDDDLDDDHHGPIDKPPREPGRPVKWYRPKLTREQLSRLNRKSDLLGLAQTLGYLLTLVATGAAFVASCFYLPWLAPIALLVHGGCCAFLINGFHELVHESVFATRPLNGFFLRIFSFLGWYNHVSFWASHTEHHKFTLHPPDDQEVVLPQQATWPMFLRLAIVDYRGLRWTLQGTVRHALGKLNGAWEEHLFVTLKPEMRPALHRWARLLIVGHLGIGAVSIATGFWPLWIAISFARFFGAGVHWLCNASQHIGLVDHYPDFRLCCRTIHLSPVLRFLYWHMNFHTEHHMYAGVPCYNLGRLHAMIRHEMPESPRGLYRTWRQIGAILKRQRVDPGYQYLPSVPNPVLTPRVGEAGE